MTMTHTRQTLKARYDEARDIKNAWEHRLRQAEAQHTEATRAGLDNTATLRNIKAIEISFDDAAGQLAVAMDAWMAAVHHVETPRTYRR